MEFEAYKVFYTTTSKENSIIVLVDKHTIDIEASVMVALSEKDVDYRMHSSFCKIKSWDEVPLSAVMIKDLSITEFLSLTKPRE